MNQRDLHWGLSSKLMSGMFVGRENQVFSPVCIIGLLELLRMGSAGDTKAELQGLLSNASAGISFEETYGLGATKRTAESYEAMLSLGVWIDESVSPEKEFIDACDDSGIQHEKTDLSKPESGDFISKWIFAKTNGLLKPEVALPSDALTCFVSALYFKDAWSAAFSESCTRAGVFHGEDGDCAADYMIGSRYTKPRESEGFVSLDLSLSGGAHFVFVMPTDGRSLSDAISDGSLERKLEEAGSRVSLGSCEREAYIRVHLPIFEAESTYSNLIDSFKRIGFETAAMPNLRKITGTERTIADVVHGARISVDEQGVEGASYTMYGATMGIPPKPIDVRFDRPFAFAIVSRTGFPLFIGIVVKTQSGPVRWQYCDEESRLRYYEMFWDNLELNGLCHLTMKQNLKTGEFIIECSINGAFKHKVVVPHDNLEEAQIIRDGMKDDIYEFVVERGYPQKEIARWAKKFKSKWK